MVIEKFWLTDLHGYLWKVYLYGDLKKKKIVTI